MSARPLSLASLLGLVAACASAQPDPSADAGPGASAAGDAVFTGSESPDELALAERLARPHLQILAHNHDFSRSFANRADLLVSRVRVDELLMAHTRVQQTLGGVPVFGSEAIVSLDEAGQLAHLTDNLIDVDDIDTRPDWDADEAIDLALDRTDLWEDMHEEPTATLVVLPHEGETYLAWDVQLKALERAQPTMPRLFIDAHTGETIWQIEGLKTAAGTGKGTTGYYGSVTLYTYKTTGTGAAWYLEDTTRDIGTYTMNGGYSVSTADYVTDSDGNNTWTDSADTSAVSAHYAARLFYDYYNKTYGRLSIDGAGGPGYVQSVASADYVVSVFANLGTNYVNAYWDGSAIYIGDGDGVDASSLATIDIVGHEMTHGITTNEANLTYAYEPGALDEGIADIFGTMVEFYSGKSTDWTLGEDCWTPGTAGDALRYMNDPTLDGASSDHYTNRYTGSGDNGGVHLNSGIVNLSFYLLSQGGTHPSGYAGSVTGIGKIKAAAIWYRALTTYMTASTDFAGARTALLSAATDLYGASSTEYAAVQNAWYTVGVGSAASSSSSCTGYTTTYTGTLSATGALYYEPGGTYYTSAASGTHAAKLSMASGSNFDLKLQKWVGGTGWSNVATSLNTGSTNETISYSGTAANYRYQVKSTSGSGAYTLCVTKP